MTAQIWTISKAEPGNTVYIRAGNSDRVLPVYVSESDAHAVMLELSHILIPRPMVYDLLLNTIKALGGQLTRVEIYGIKNGAYLTRIVITQNGQEHQLESRPPDILCLAARMDCPVMIAETVFKESALPLSEVPRTEEKPQTAPPAEKLSIARFLNKELENAVAAEDYERAARLRDRLREYQTGESPSL